MLPGKLDFVFPSKPFDLSVKFHIYTWILSNICEYKTSFQHQWLSQVFQCPISVLHLLIQLLQISQYSSLWQHFIFSLILCLIILSHLLLSHSIVLFIPFSLWIPIYIAVECFTVVWEKLLLKINAEINKSTVVCFFFFSKPDDLITSRVIDNSRIWDRNISEICSWCLSEQLWIPSSVVDLISFQYFTLSLGKRIWLL